MAASDISFIDIKLVMESAGAVRARTANYAEPGLSLHLADGLVADCAERDLCPADLVALAREAF